MDWCQREAEEDVSGGRLPIVALRDVGLYLRKKMLDERCGNDRDLRNSGARPDRLHRVICGKQALERVMQEGARLKGR